MIAESRYSVSDLLASSEALADSVGALYGLPIGSARHSPLGRIWLVSAESADGGLVPDSCLKPAPEGPLREAAGLACLRALGGRSYPALALRNGVLSRMMPGARAGGRERRRLSRDIGSQVPYLRLLGYWDANKDNLLIRERDSVFIDWGTAFSYSEAKLVSRIGQLFGGPPPEPFFDGYAQGASGVLAAYSDPTVRAELSGALERAAAETHYSRRKGALVDGTGMARRAAGEMARVADELAGNDPFTAALASLPRAGRP